MTDQELLEKAAKAAGISLGEWEHSEDAYQLPDEYDRYWNPLTDDGDAFRLLVHFGFEYGVVNRGDLTATRRAIVETAATL